MEEHDEHDELLPDDDTCCSGSAKASTVDTAEQAAEKYPGPDEFTHLHVHTLFSTLDGVAAPSEYCERAKHFGHQAIAATDHGSLGSFPDMYWSCKEQGMKFIPGIEAYLNEYHPIFAEMRQEKGFKFGDVVKEDPELASRIRRNRHLIILAKDDTGFKNLLNLTTQSWETGYYYKPRIWMNIIRKYKEGLIFLSGCLNGPISFELSRAVEYKRAGEKMAAAESMQKAINWIKLFQEEFDSEWYFEIQMPGPELEAGYDVLQLSLALAKKFGVKTVLTGDCHYLHREDFMTQRAMMAIGAGKTINDPDQFIIDTSEGFLKSRAEFRQTFYEQGYEPYASIKDIEAAADRTLEITEKCSNWTPDLSPKLPVIEDADNLLTKKVAEGLIKKGLINNKNKYLVDGQMVTYVEQVKIELDRIKEKEFSSYFLMTCDLVNYSRNIGYPVGPARGSVGGSLVSYLLGITEMDPLKWGLSFNRFLSPSRGGYMLKCKME